MQPEARDKAYLWDMVQAAQDIFEFVSGMTFEQFSEDKKTRYAVERQLLSLGEAANHCTESFRKKHTEIPWRQLVGQRNVIAHEYGEILVERIWIVAKENIPKLIEALQKLLPEKRDQQP